MPEAAAAKPRSFADDLRQRNATQIETLFRLRPDLLDAQITDLSRLASVATDALSTGLALDNLDARQLAIIELLAALPDPFTRPSAEAAAGFSIGEDLTDLWARGLIWGAEDLHLVRFARDAFGPYPCGLAPELIDRKPVLRQWVTEPQLVTAAVQALPESARTTLMELAHGRPDVTYAGALGAIDELHPRDDIQLLMARHLLIATDGSTVVVPREVALPLRQNRWLLIPPPSAKSTFTAVPNADAAAAAIGYSAVRTLSTTVTAMGAMVLRISRNRTLVRADVDALAAATGRTREEFPMVLNFGILAGVFGVDPAEPDLLSVTRYADTWQSLPIEQQWVTVAQPWLRNCGVAAILATDSVIDPDKMHPRAVRDSGFLVQAVMEQLVTAPEDEGLAHPCTEEGWLEFLRPRIAHEARGQLDMWVAAATRLGLLVRNCAPTFTRALRDGNCEVASSKFLRSLSPAVEVLYVQPDNTIVVPGRPSSDLLQELAMFADIEKEDSALVARVTPTSINRGMYSGKTSDHILTFLKQRSQTPVSQSIEYLLQDQQRRFGSLKAVAATSIIVADDEAEVSRILSDARLRGLHLIRVSSTVLVSDAELNVAIEQLQALGYSPVTDRTSNQLTARRAGQSVGALPLVATQPDAGDLRTRLARALIGTSAHNTEAKILSERPLKGNGVVERLHEAQQSQQEIVLVFALPDGLLNRLKATVVHIGEGFVTVYGTVGGTVQTISTSKITSVD